MPILRIWLLLLSPTMWRLPTEACRNVTLTSDLAACISMDSFSCNHSNETKSIANDRRCKILQL